MIFLYFLLQYIAQFQTIQSGDNEAKILVEKRRNFRQENVEPAKQYLLDF